MAEETKPGKKRNPAWFKPGQSGNPSGKGGNPEAIVPYQFKAGQSGNPLGRPKEKLYTRTLRLISDSLVPDDPQGRKYGEVLAQKHMMDAVNGKLHPKMVAELIDRLDGKTLQSVNMNVTTATREEKQADLLQMIEDLRTVEEVKP